MTKEKRHMLANIKTWLEMHEIFVALLAIVAILAMGGYVFYALIIASSQATDINTALSNPTNYEIWVWIFFLIVGFLTVRSVAVD